MRRPAPAIACWPGTTIGPSRPASSCTSRAPSCNFGRMRRVLIATSNPGKLRDFAGAAVSFGIEIAPLPGFSTLPTVAEDGDTFEANARKKAEHYSRFAAGQAV